MRSDNSDKIPEIKAGQVWKDSNNGFAVILWVKEERVCYDYRCDNCDSRHYPCYDSIEEFFDDPPTLVTEQEEAFRSIPSELVAMAEGFYGERNQDDEDKEEDD